MLNSAKQFVICKGTGRIPGRDANSKGRDGTGTQIPRDPRGRGRKSELRPRDRRDRDAKSKGRKGTGTQICSGTRPRYTLITIP